MSKKKDPWVCLGMVEGDGIAQPDIIWYYNDGTNMLREETITCIRDYENDGEATLPHEIQVALAELTGEYATVCPMCGGDIHLVEYKGTTSIPVQSAGWDLGAESCDTSDEVFMCTGDCGKYVPSDYVFKVIDRDAAKKLMEAICLKKKKSK